MPPKFVLKPKAVTTASPGPVVYPPYNPNPITLEEEVLAGVIEWYMARGLPVPQEDLDACKGIDAAAEAATKAEIAAPVVPPKPAYGTPEFWKEWWAKKRAKQNLNSEGARGAGCPPKEAATREAGIPIPEPKPKPKAKPTKEPATK